MTTTRPSPWRTPFAVRTYLAGAAWLLAVLLSRLLQVPESAGWLRLRTDPGGLLFYAACVIGGRNFVGAGLRALRRLRLDMNFLMTAAMVAAVIIGEPFEAATLAFLFSAAELLERYAVDRGRRALAELVAIAPEDAELVEDGGTTSRVSVEALLVGQRVRVRPGGKVPADGTVLAGDSLVNEASITGESLPRSKRVGDRVFAGTMNGDGTLDVDVTADARHSTFARIVELVRVAESRRAPAEQLVERFAAWYTPIVVVLSLAVALIPSISAGQPDVEWITRAITLLVIACPCALVIATPVTMVSALTSAARNGVLVKGAEHLDTLASVRALAVDKTGTLTTGQLTVEQFNLLGTGDASRVLALAGNAEERSEHPVARAIATYARASGISTLPVTEFTAERGKGVRAVVDGVAITIGTEEIVGDAVARSAPATPPGAMRAYITTASGDVGMFTLRDVIRVETADVLRALHARGVSPIVMLTGDSDEAAAVIGASAGVDEIRSRLLPHEKVAAVEDLRTAHGKIAMLGDGVNDAPALAAASVGLVMGAAGSPAAIETADIALMSDNLLALPYTFDLARRTRAVVRWNIAIALALKVALGVGAALGSVNLAMAVLLGDVGGALFVTANALRLAGLRPGLPSRRQPASTAWERPRLRPIRGAEPGRDA
ncbi:MAG: cadmium-translocating P-type ATPase [Gemmatimonadetes bacterium]|nr:cadmium-translocating P-type ATPase [Gemmatimonadota bacterium]